MNEHDYAVIMAGGGGTRLWPVSRKDRPKQLLPLLGEETLFQGTVARLIDMFPPERILVVTVEQQAAEMKKQVPEIPAENYLIEPAPRGTASVVGLAATVLCKRDADATMAVLPSTVMSAPSRCSSSLICSAVERSCVMYTKDMPNLSLRFIKMSRMIARKETSIIETGSSATMMRGFSSSARAIITRCNWPPLS